MRPQQPLVLAACLAAAVSGWAHAVDRLWVGPSGNLFFDPSSWSPAGMPMAGDQAFFDLSNASTTDVSFAGVSPVNVRLLVREGLVHFDMFAGTTYTLTASTGSGVLVGYVANEAATLSMDDGAVSCVRGSIATALNSTGTVNVVFGSEWNCSDVLTVGSQGDATLNVTSSSSLASNGAVIGEFAGGDGSVLVQASTWDNSGSLVIGKNGHGQTSFNISSAIANTDCIIAENAGSTGSAEASFGCEWANFGTLTIGGSGDGSLIVNTTGVVTSEGSVIGANAGSNGEAIVTNIGSLWLCDGDLSVGLDGAGELTISDGASVDASGNAFLGRNPSGAGTMVVSGLTDACTIGGDLSVGQLGVGDLAIQSGGDVNCDAAIIGDGLGSSGTLLVANPASRLDCSENVMVGFNGAGSMTIANGGLVTSALIADVAQGAASTGDVLVTGPGSQWFSGGAIRLGLNGGYATLTVADGGLVDPTFGLLVHDHGTVMGDGTIDATLLNNVSGVVRPGLSAGTLTVDGGFMQGTDGHLRLEIAGTGAGQHDLLAVTGSATLDGTLDLSLLDGYMPVGGEQIQILTAASIAGTFARINPPVNTLPHLVWSVAYSGTSARVLVTTRELDLLVGNNDGNSVVRYDDGSGDFIDAFIPSGSGGLADPEQIAIGPDGFIYAANLGPDNVLRFDAVTGAFVSEFVAPGSGGLVDPAGMAFGPDGHLYVGAHNLGTIHRYDGTTGAFIDLFATAPGIGHLHHLTFGPDGHLYVSVYDDAPGTSAVWRYDGETGEFMDVFSSGGGLENPAGLAFGPDGNLYVAGGFSWNVVRYDGVSGVLIDEFVPVGGGGLSVPWGLAFGPDGNLYVGSAATNNVLRYDRTTGAYIDTFIDSGCGLLNPSAIMFMPTAPQSLGDIDGDGAIDINDLLAVISAWGACPAPPRPCPADLDCDSAVSINDLLIVISNWGP
jgi:T5SS/PEP-CTERM-associated repeat protein